MNETKIIVTFRHRGKVDCAKVTDDALTASAAAELEIKMAGLPPYSISNHIRRRLRHILRAAVGQMRSPAPPMPTAIRAWRVEEVKNG